MMKLSTPHAEDEQNLVAGLHAALPPADAPALPGERHRALRSRLTQEFRRDLDEGARPARPRPKWLKVALPTALAGTLVAGVAVTGGLTDVFGPQVDEARHRQAVELLDRLAVAAAAAPATTIRDDQFIYVKTEGSQEAVRRYGNSFRVVGTWQVQREDWTSVDGSRDGYVRQEVVSGPPTNTPPGTGRAEADPNASTYRELTALPTDPDKLVDKLYEDAGGDGPAEQEAVFEAVGDMLDTATLLPEKSAALYRAVAKLPGVVAVDTARDAAGREGIGLTITSDGDERTTWVFRPSDLTYLGSTEQAVLDVGVVDRVRETP